MKIVIAPDSFKESLSALTIAQTIKQGFSEIYPAAEYILLPAADGGEGTVDAMVDALQGQKITVAITDPLGAPGWAFYGLSGDGHCAIIEMASASGLERVPLNQRDARITTSYGTGELIKDALGRGVKKCIIGIGGSATNDGGVGMLQALGVSFLDKQHNPIGLGGQALAQLAYIDVSGLDPRIKTCEFEVACDVSNPLTGPNGASAIFGPQKGATPEIVKQLDDNLKHYAEIIRRDVGIDVEHIPGTGAAGGMGAGLLAFCQAHLRPGIEIVTELLGIEALIKEADLVITGEGRLDYQSINGKVPVGIAHLAKRYHKPTIAIVGGIGKQFEVVYQHGITAIFSILSSVVSLEEALEQKQAIANLYLCARNVAASLQIGSQLATR